MKYFTVFCLAIALVSCSQKKGTDTQEEMLSPTSTVTEFLKWYRTNYEKLMQITMVDGGIYQRPDSTKNYSVNFTGTEEYLTQLKSTGFISDQYVDEWRAYFKKADDDMKASPENDGPPMWFDYDLIMLSQDFDLAEIEKATTTEALNDGKATVTFEFYPGYILKYSLSTIDGKWMIDKIENKSS